MHHRLSPASVRHTFRVVVAISAFFAPAQAFTHEDGMMQREMMDLSSLAADRQVTSLRYCDGLYIVTTGAGNAVEFPEFDLRFKTDASEMGPPAGTPALLPAGMMGDRAFVIFAEPEEISRFIERGC